MGKGGEYDWLFYTWGNWGSAVMSLAQGHTGGTWLSHDLNPHWAPKLQVQGQFVSLPLMLRAMEDVEMAAQSKDMRCLLKFIHSFFLSQFTSTFLPFLPNAQNKHDLRIKWDNSSEHLPGNQVLKRRLSLWTRARAWRGCGYSHSRYCHFHCRPTWPRHRSPGWRKMPMTTIQKLWSTKWGP